MRQQHHETEINITPLLDIVFIMLIFFIVTTSFVKEQGLDINRPIQAPVQQTEQQELIVVRIDNNTAISLDDRNVMCDALRANFIRMSVVKPAASLLIAAHTESDTDTLVAVVDAAKVAGIDSISVAKLDT